MNTEAKEIKRLEGIIARNALQRLAGEDGDRMHVTLQDIEDGLDILYKYQAEQVGPKDAGEITEPDGLAVISGVLTHAGSMRVGDDEEATGLFISCERIDLIKIKRLPMYERVAVTLLK